MNHRAWRQLRISGSNRYVAPHRSGFAKIHVRAQSRHIARDRAPGIDLDPSKHHRDIASYVSMNANRAKQARNIARRLSLGDRNVIANTGAVLATLGECRKSGGKKQSNGEEQSTHKKTSWASVRPELICGLCHGLIK
jgi:hypothetical protein